MMHVTSEENFQCTGGRSDETRSAGVCRCEAYTVQVCVHSVLMGFVQMCGCLQLAWRKTLVTLFWLAFMDSATCQPRSTIVTYYAAIVTSVLFV